MSAPVLKKVHTFADDLNLARSERGIVAKQPEPQAQKLPTAAPAANQVLVTEAANAGPKKIITATSATLKPSANDLPATIITDQRGKRFSLTAEMSSAIGDWWNDTVQSVKKTKKNNLYSVPAAERRKGVVTTATTHTGRHAANDYHAVVERVKAKPEVAPIPVVTPLATTSKVIATAPEINTIDGWETDAEAPVVADVSPEPVIVQTAAAEVVSLTETSHPVSNDTRDQVTVTDVVYRQPRIEPVMPDLAAELVEPEVMTFTAPEIAEVESSTPVEPIRITPQPTPRQFEKITPVTPIAPVTNNQPTLNAFAALSEIPAPTIQNKPDYVKASIATRKENRGAATETKKQNWFSGLVPYMLGGSFVLGTITYFMMAGTSSSTSTIAGDTTLPTNTNDNIETLPDTTVGGVVTVQLDAPNKTSLFNAIRATANQGEGVQLVTPLAHDTTLPLGSRELLGFLNRQFAPAFIGSVTNVRVGMYREAPVIILTVSDTTAARGSMFEWESTMSQDLSPWFGISIPRTTQSGFTDAQVASTDVRVLKDDIGAERITYGIINQSTILITTDSTAFLNLTENYNLF